ncbi:MAG: hypothetical protein PHP41_04605 [Bacilli bacterium]|nr:hypothetical protein [Bacilli bacterium]
MTFRAKIMAITPMICTIAFLAFGFLWDKWHPGWMIFFLIPIMPFLLGYKKIKFTVPLVILIVYLILGFGFEAWHPGWIVFLLIPVIQILITPTKKEL